ncbi:hypothetical protein MGU_05102 [Metarhizium guizhouense ARSEF 977]|uniref:Uncharacterized protein n=1 Tax=Metarhizium guizhouense (strain ARSEF 977) TaxID=1276136 RepID=A0A0B4I4Y3_METGA|nr:hypothetical protein MGU_05102 [Metarhizium guizhouense ARSEF 977]
MKSLLEDSPGPSSPPSPAPPPPPYTPSTPSNNIKGKYRAHKDFHFKGGRARIKLQKDMNFPPLIGPWKYDKKAHNDAPWIAYMDIRFKDVCATMEQGLYWSQDNIDPNGSCFFNTTDPALLAYDFFRGRRFHLIDLAENPQWKGELEVYASSAKTLSEFRIQNTLVDNITSMTAFTGDERWIYAYKRGDPGQNFNAIYDDMPLRGWWPWPKNAHI